MQIFLSKIRYYTMALKHKYTEIYPRNLEGKKPTFLELRLLSLFHRLHYIKCLQYNIRFQPTSETLIPIPELENHGLKNLIPLTTKQLITEKVKKQKSNPKKILGPLPPNPWIRVADNGFGANTLKTNRGGPSGLPPSGVGAQRVRLVELGVKLHAKNIT